MKRLLFALAALAATAAVAAAETLPELEGIYPGIEVELIDSSEIEGRTVTGYMVTSEDRPCHEYVSGVEDETGLIFTVEYTFPHPRTGFPTTGYYFVDRIEKPRLLLVFIVSSDHPEAACLGIVMTGSDRGT